jgi:hypothetical protein
VQRKQTAGPPGQDFQFSGIGLPFTFETAVNAWVRMKRLRVRVSLKRESVLPNAGQREFRENHSENLTSAPGI